MGIYVPSPEAAARITEEFAEQGLGIDDLCDQVFTRVQIADAVCGKAALTPRRLVRTVFDVMAARRRNSLAPFPERVVTSVFWLFTSPDFR
jgi:hypothetical protein